MTSPVPASSPPASLQWAPKPHCDGLYARLEVGEEAHVVEGSGGWLAFAPNLVLPPVGRFWPSEEAAKDAVKRSRAGGVQWS